MVRNVRVMGIGVRKEKVVEGNVMAGLEVKWDDGKYEGWMTDWSGRRKVLTQEQEEEFDYTIIGQPTHIIQYDDGQITPTLTKTNGWLTGKMETG